jgi:ATP-dependent RNA helicase DDX3X
LNKANYNTISIHGDKNQQKRQEAINKFKSGDVPILIATDVASRGIDFPNVTFVFNFEMPTNIDDYIHRIGRTGRCGNKGSAVSFISEKSKPVMKDLYKLLKKQNQIVPDWMEEFARRADYDKGCNNILI